ncbi:MAG: triose-phosphate isomerase [candidate division WOR-3 bacterium]
MAKWVIANWKMHFSLTEAESAARQIADFTAGSPVKIGIAPPFPFLKTVRDAVPARVMVGAQNLFWEDKGAFTGEVSGPMLRSLGVDFVIIGHSERRKHFGETDEMVNKKIRAALEVGLIPLVCIGETLEEREAGRASEVVKRQIEKGLAGVAGRILLAYEPVWSIGTGVNATPAQAGEMHALIKGILGDVPVLYGGSVSPENAGELARTKGVDGFLVGGASLLPEKFSRIVSEVEKSEVQK